jgi:hypothetical protein
MLDCGSMYVKQTCLQVQSVIDFAFYSGSKVALNIFEIVQDAPNSGIWRS